jgi:hypothetical protein
MGGPLLNRFTLEDLDCDLIGAETLAEISRDVCIVAVIEQECQNYDHGEGEGRGAFRERYAALP